LTKDFRKETKDMKFEKLYSHVFCLTSDVYLQDAIKTLSVALLLLMKS